MIDLKANKEKERENPQEQKITMSQHLNGSHRRSGDSNSRERQPRNASLNAANNNSTGGNNTGADYASTNERHSRSRANNQSNENQIKEAIIDLYLKVKIRSNDEVSQSDTLYDHTLCIRSTPPCVGHTPRPYPTANLTEPLRASFEPIGYTCVLLALRVKGGISLAGRRLREICL